MRDRLLGVQLLFLLDNVDRADQVRELIGELEGVTWVLTARAVGLKRAGVVALDLEPPPPAEATAMLLAHCRYAAVSDRGDLAVAQAVVERLGCLPLAIALASGSLTSGQVTSFAALGTRLASGGLRQHGRTSRQLRALFDQAVDALGPKAREAFELCGVFPTPVIPLESYQSVGRGARLASSTDELEALAGVSLIDLPSPEIIRLHVLAHEYARLRLEMGPAYAATRESFLAHYVFLAECISRDAEEFERRYFALLTEEENLLAAAETLHAIADWSRLQRLWHTLSGYLWNMGNYRDYARLDGMCLDGARATADGEWTAVLLSELGYTALELSNWTEADPLLQEAQSLYDAMSGATFAQARLRRYRAQVALGLGDAGHALVLLAEAEAVLTQHAVEPTAGPTAATAWMLLHSARMTAHVRQRDWPAAEAAGRHALALYRLLPIIEGGHRFGEFRVELGDVLLEVDRADEAAELWREVLRDREGMPQLPIHTEVERRLTRIWGEKDRTIPAR